MQQQRGQGLADLVLGAPPPQTHQESLGAYLLLDQSAFPDASAYWPPLKGLLWEPVLASRAGQPDGGTPLLFDVGTCQESTVLARWLRNLCHAAAYANALSLVQSPLSCSQLAQSLQARTQVTLPQNFSVVLRLFDTRVLPLLPSLLKPDQYADFLSCASRWSYLGRAGQLMQLPSSAVAVATPAATAAAYTSPLVLDQEQERLLIEDGLCDAVVDQLLDHRHPSLQGLNPAEQFAKISSWLRGAEQLGIEDVPNMTRYCYAAYERGDDFASREPWQQRLAQAQRGEISIEKALDDEQDANA